MNGGGGVGECSRAAGVFPFSIVLLCCCAEREFDLGRWSLLLLLPPPPPLCDVGCLIFIN